VQQLSPAELWPSFSAQSALNLRKSGCAERYIHVIDVNPPKSTLMNSNPTNVTTRLGSIGLALFFAATGPAMAEDYCPPGYWSPDGLVDKEVLCQPGYYTCCEAMGSPTPANIGYYVTNAGATFETICQAGYYTPHEAMSAPIPADPGYYVSASGAGGKNPCSPGYYTPNAAMTNQIAADPGYYVPSPASSSETLCPGGYYAPGYGTATPIPCQSGYYAPPGSSNSTRCSKGYYAPALSSAPIISPAGDFVPSPGASAPTVDFPGTWSHAGSIAVRAASPSVSRNLGNYTVGPIYFATPSPTINLTSGSASLTVSNKSTDLGFADSLTGLSLLSATLSSGNAANFQITGFVAGTVLYEKDTANINLSVVNPSSLAAGTYSTTLTVQTDQSAPFGSPGASFNYTVTVSVPPPTLHIALANSTNIVLTWSNPSYNLQTAPEVAGTYTTITGATSPYTNTITSGRQFFRLIKQ
jgi:hypothetical protein